MIPYGRHEINQADIDSVVEVLKSDFLTQGPVVPAFERAVSAYCNSKYGVAVNSATSALHVACLALGVEKGDLVWTSPITFVASANCALYCGAKIDFVDINPTTYNIDIECLEEKLFQSAKVGRLPKVLIPVHLSGQSCEMERIHSLSQKYGFKIIEDASHAIGGRYKNEAIGCCRYSDITIFSFHPVKIITTGEGGVALTNNLQLYSSMLRYRSHGITRDPLEMTNSPDGSWYYQQIDLGFNYRMTDIQAALGISQLSRLDELVKERHKIANCYDELLQGMPIKKPTQHVDAYSSFHLYIIRAPNNHGGVNRKVIFERLRSHGVGVNVHYIPVYRHPYYQTMGFIPALFPEAERYYSEAISLPIYPGLTKTQQLEVVKNLATPIGHQTLF